jgi:hypothetical protein
MAAGVKGLFFIYSHVSKSLTWSGTCIYMFVCVYLLIYLIIQSTPALTGSYAERGCPAFPPEQPAYGFRSPALTDAELKTRPGSRGQKVSDAQAV